MIKLNFEEVARYAKDYWGPDSIPFLQVAVYVMVGGGLMGRSAAEQPAGFYIDDRVGRRPYKKAEVMQAVKTLATIAKVNGMDPNNLPAVPNFNNMGVF